MSDETRNIALCYLPYDKKLRTFRPTEIENFTSIDDYWMKRTGLVFFPFDRNRRAYFYRSDERQGDSAAFEFTPNELLQQEEYETSVLLAKAAMAAGEMQKVVLARNKLLKRTFSALNTFNRSMEMHPDSHCFLVDIEDEVWIGASPELLLSYENGELHTMALAGTRSLEEEFSHKEIEEHKLVEDFIEEKLNLLNLDFRKGERSERVQSSIKHLKTDYFVNCSAEDALDVLKHLHPTSAVCGLPRDHSFNFIQSYESMNRGFYSGITGILEEDRAIFFVNLRCMRFYANSVELFAGAGITSESDPKTEWIETERKMAVMEQLLC